MTGAVAGARVADEAGSPSEGSRARALAETGLGIVAAAGFCSFSREDLDSPEETGLEPRSCRGGTSFVGPCRSLAVYNRWPLKKKLILGDEHDDGLRQSLLACLASLGGDVAARQWGLGGSQTLETMRVYLGKDLLVVEAETYVGLSIHGEARVVNRVADALKKRAG